MPEAVLASKDPRKVRAGQIGAAKRWTPEHRTTVRLDALTVEQRAVVLALVNAADAAKKAATSSKVTAQEVDRVSDQPRQQAA